MVEAWRGCFCGLPGAHLVLAMQPSVLQLCSSCSASPRRLWASPSSCPRPPAWPWVLPRCPFCKVLAWVLPGSLLPARPWGPPLCCPRSPAQAGLDLGSATSGYQQAERCGSQRLCGAGPGLLQGGRATFCLTNSSKAACALLTSQAIDRIERRWHGDVTV